MEGAARCEEGLCKKPIPVVRSTPPHRAAQGSRDKAAAPPAADSWRFVSRAPWFSGARGRGIPPGRSTSDPKSVAAMRRKSSGYTNPRYPTRGQRISTSRTSEKEERGPRASTTPSTRTSETNNKHESVYILIQSQTQSPLLRPNQSTVLMPNPLTHTLACDNRRAN